MIVALSIALAIVTVTLAVVAVATHETLLQIRALRAELGVDDKPMKLEVTRELRAAELGIGEPGLRCMAVVLSPHCGSCIAIAEAFRGGAPEAMWFVVLASGADPESLAVTENLDAVRGRLIVDKEERILRALGLEVTPLVLLFDRGLLETAYAVSTPRQVFDLIPTTKGSEVAVGGQTER